MNHIRLLPVAASSAFLFVSSIASAQQPPAPLPPPGQYQPPPGQYQPPPGAYPPPNYQQPPNYYPPPNYQQPPPGYYPPPQGGQYPPPGYQQPPPGYYPPPPPPRAAPPPEPPEPPEPPTHCPKFSLWIGPRLGYMFYGLGFYTKSDGDTEGTGRLVGNGLTTQIDIGARISYHYIPYLFYEHGFLGDGARFKETDPSTSTYSRFYGIGLRHVSGDVDSVAFVSDAAFGLREVIIAQGDNEWRSQGLALANIGLGAEIRAATLFSISPMIRLSAGSLDNPEVKGAALTTARGQSGSGTGLDFNGNRPNYLGSELYVAVQIGVGVHFDVFGK